MNSWLVIEPKMNASAKCSIKLAFDSESSSSKGGDGYILEKVLISAPAYHRINSKIFDLEVFMLYSSTQSDGTKVYVCMCSLYNGADTVAQNDWRHTTYRLMNELFGNVDKIPAKGQTMGIGSPPNPIDMENLIPREGFRNFYEYTHPNNTKVNFRIFSSPMLVSNAVLKNLQMKLYSGAEFANAKQAILQATNPADGLFIFFSQDVTRNIDSALNGKLLEPNSCPSIPVKSKKKESTTKKATKSITKGTKKATKSISKGTNKAIKSINKNIKKTNSKKKKEKFSNMNDSDEEDIENDSDGEDFENGDDETEEFENENEDDEEEDFENEEEGFAEISGEEKKEKKAVSGSISATILVSIITFVVFYFALPKIPNLEWLNDSTLYKIALPILTIISGVITYYSTQSDKKIEKIEEKKQDDLEKQKNARTGLMFTLGFMIITPYFFFAIMNKLMNDPTFEGLGNYNFDPNEVLKLLNDLDFKKIIQAKLIYMIILVIQVFLSFFLILSLMMKNTGDIFMTFMNLASAMSVFATVSIMNYMWQRSNKPFDNYAVSELDYYSVLSMGIKNWYVLLFDSRKTLDLSELLIGNNKNETVQPSAPPSSSMQFVQQGGTISANRIDTKNQVPGMDLEDLDETLKKMAVDKNKKGDWGALFQNMSGLGKIIFISFFIIFTILWIVLTSVLVQNNTNQIQTTGAAIGLTLGYLFIGMTGVYLGYQGVSYLSEMKKKELVMDEETLEHYTPMEYIEYTDAQGNMKVTKIPKSLADIKREESGTIPGEILKLNPQTLGVNPNNKEQVKLAIQAYKKEIQLKPKERRVDERRRIWRQIEQKILRGQSLEVEEEPEPETGNGAPLETQDVRRMHRPRPQLQSENEVRTTTPSGIKRAISALQQAISSPPAREGDVLNPPSIGSIGRRRPQTQLVSDLGDGIRGPVGTEIQGVDDEGGVLTPMMRSAKRQIRRLSGLDAADEGFGRQDLDTTSQGSGDEGGVLTPMMRSAKRQIRRLSGLDSADDAFRQTSPSPSPGRSGDDGSVMRTLDRMRGVRPMSPLSSGDEGIYGETPTRRGVETGYESPISEMDRSKTRRQRKTKQLSTPENFDPSVIYKSRIRSLSR
jgi:hypothetical protein